MRSQLGVYSLGAVPVDECGELEEHLARCPGCRAECEQLIHTVLLLSTLPEIPDPCGNAAT